MTKRRKNAKPAVRLAYVDPATPETRARLMEGTVARLVRNKRIGGEELMAAQEIERVYFEITKSLFAKTGQYGERLDPATGTDLDWSPSMMAAHRRYLAWTKAVKPGVPNLVFSILADGMTAREIDRARQWRSNTAATVFVEALHDYAQMAGWLSRRRTA